MTLGQDLELVQQLAKFKRLHVRVSIKGASEEEFHKLTGAIPEAYDLAYQALSHLIKQGVSCNACLVASFSDADGIQQAKQRLGGIAPGILKSLEIERIKQFPKVRSRLQKHGLKANKGVSCVSPAIIATDA